MYRATWITAAVVAVLVGFMWITGFSNPGTDAGYVMYAWKQAVYGKAHPIGMVKGPSSVGVGFLQDGAAISVTPFTYTEEFQVGTNGQPDESVVANDKLRVGFRVDVQWGVRADAVDDFYDHWAVINEAMTDKPDQVALATYKNQLSPEVRMLARQTVERYPGLSIKDHQFDIGAAIKAGMDEYTKGTPFYVRAVTVGGITPPQEVLDKITEVSVERSKLDQMDNQVQQHLAQKYARIVEANGIHKAMVDVKDSLTPNYLAWEAIKTLKEMQGSKNHSITFLPHGMTPVPNLPVTPPTAH